MENFQDDGETFDDMVILVGGGAADNPGFRRWSSWSDEESKEPILSDATRMETAKPVDFPDYV